MYHDGIDVSRNKDKNDDDDEHAKKNCSDFKIF